MSNNKSQPTLAQDRSRDRISQLFIPGYLLVRLVALPRCRGACFRRLANIAWSQRFALRLYAMLVEPIGIEPMT
jgi:hypothetical protein